MVALWIGLRIKSQVRAHSVFAGPHFVLLVRSGSHHNGLSSYRRLSIPQEIWSAPYWFCCWTRCDQLPSVRCCGPPCRPLRCLAVCLVTVLIRSSCLAGQTDIRPLRTVRVIGLRTCACELVKSLPQGTGMKAPAHDVRCRCHLQGMIEQAARMRTYVVRVRYAGVFSCGLRDVHTTFEEAGNAFAILGQGRQCSTA